MAGRPDRGVGPVTLVPAPDGYPIKIVRDATAAIINESGEPGELWYEPLPAGSDRLPWLKKKLMEEVVEYLIDGDVDELADVVSVLRALAIQHNMSLEQLTELADADERGGFFYGVMMYGRHKEFDR